MKILLALQNNDLIKISHFSSILPSTDFQQNKVSLQWTSVI